MLLPMRKTTSKRSLLLATLCASPKTLQTTEPSRAHKISADQSSLLVQRLVGQHAVPEQCATLRADIWPSELLLTDEFEQISARRVCDVLSSKGRWPDILVAPSASISSAKRKRQQYIVRRLVLDNFTLAAA